jgi:hypothetical protein
MWNSRRVSFRIALLGLGLSACRTGVAGHYELDLVETKICVAKSALDNPDDADMKQDTIELLEKTSVDVALDPAGKMTSTTTLTGEGSPTPQVSEGTWKLEGQRVLLTVRGVADTKCDVEGERLRCQKPTPGTLFSNYVLVRK